MDIKVGDKVTCKRKVYGWGMPGRDVFFDASMVGEVTSIVPMDDPNDFYINITFGANLKAMLYCDNILRVDK
jgi:hypothetical protein